MKSTLLIVVISPRIFVEQPSAFPDYAAKLMTSNEYTETGPPAWVADAVFYQIFPDRFARSGRVDLGIQLEGWDEPPSYTGYKGGDLWGVIEKLDYLKDLGITALWFNPIFQSASNHRYHTHDYTKIDPVLGGNEAFDALIKETKARDMRVILDGVFNHASRGFYQFSDIAEHQEKSAFLDWFNVYEFPIDPYNEDKPAGYQAWWGLHALPEFNTEHEAVREFLWGIGSYWAEKGIDGWRLDVPNEVSTEGFWEEFRRRVRKANPEAYITGEIWQVAPDWVGDSGRFDGVMNYPLGTSIIAFAVGNRVNPDAIITNNDYSVTPGLNAGQFADRIDWLTNTYGPEVRTAMFNLLDSHDTARILSLADGETDLVILCLALLLTMPGAPCIYYGTEVELEGLPDPDTRRGFPWDRVGQSLPVDVALRELIALRHAEDGLRSPHIERLGPEPGGEYGRTYVFSRGEGADRIVIAVNHADESDVVPCPVQLSGDAVRLWGTASVAEASGEDATGNEICFPARSVGIWKDPA